MCDKNHLLSSHIIHPLQYSPHQPDLSSCAMSRKRVQEHSASPKFRCVTWAEKWTRQGTVFTAEVTAAASSPVTPIRPKKHTVLRRAEHSQDKKPTPSGIEAAMALPPIPAPEILAPKRDRRGKV